MKLPKMWISSLSLSLILIFVLLSSCFSLNEGYPPQDSAGTLLYEKAFSSIDGWEIGGRQEGVNKWEITEFNGETCLHLHHEEFSEIAVYKWIEIPESVRGKNLYVEVNFVGQVGSSADDKSAFFSMASLDIIANEYLSELSEWGAPSEGRIYWYRAAWVTSSYMKDHFIGGTYPEVRKLEELQNSSELKTYTFIIPGEYSAKAGYLFIRFMAYGSGWPYDLEADLWVRYVKVYATE